MDVIDYNGEGRWTSGAILSHYEGYAASIGVISRDLSPSVHSERGRYWIYPVMEKVIDGIEAGDLACVQLGTEFIEEDAKFPFGKILKSNVARALRRAALSAEQKERIRGRVLGMLRAGHVPHEFHEYAKLLRKIGFDSKDLPIDFRPNPRVERFRLYFEMCCKPGN